MQRFITIVFAAAIALPATPAAAQDDEKRGKAERLFRAGENAYNAGRYQEAAEAFEQAWETLPLPAIAFSAAQAYRLEYFANENPGHLKRSVELYRLYVEKMPEGGRRQDAVTSLAELEPLLARVEAEQRQRGQGPVQAERMTSSTTRLMVSTPIEGATVALDGGDPVPAPLIKEVTPGEHQIVVRADGYYSEQRAVTAAEGEFTPHEIELRARPALVRIKADGGADIAIDGRPAGSTPLSKPLEVPAGKHLVTVSRRGRHAWSREIDVARGQELELQVDLERTGQRTASYVVLGASATSFAVAGLYGLAAMGDDSDASSLEDKRQSEGLTAEEAARYADLVDSRDDNLTLTYTFLGVGGALAVTGGLMYFLDTPRAESPGAFSASESLTVAPLIGGDHAGIGVAGAF